MPKNIGESTENPEICECYILRMIPDIQYMQELVLNMVM